MLEWIYIWGFGSGVGFGGGLEILPKVGSR